MKNIPIFLILFILPVALYSQGRTEGIITEIEKFKGELSDNRKYPFRSSLKIDAVKLYRTILKFGKENSNLLKEYFVKSSISLPKTDRIPSRKKHNIILAVNNKEFQPYREQFFVSAVLNPDFKKLSRITLATILPVFMSSKMHSPQSEIVKWQYFFMIAQPSCRIKKGGNESVTILLDYGTHDYFEIKYYFNDMVWLPESLRWWQEKK